MSVSELFSASACRGRSTAWASRQVFAGAGERPILARIIERLKPQVCGRVINANATRRARAFGLPVVGDNIDGFCRAARRRACGLQWIRANRPASAMP